LSFESNVMPSHLMCGDGSILVVFISWVTKSEWTQ
jgi:hypothetical protein